MVPPLRTAGDRAEDIEFCKGEGGPREGAEDAGPREGQLQLVLGVDRQRWFLGQLNALSNDLLHDLVEGVLTCCSSTGSAEQKEGGRTTHQPPTPKADFDYFPPFFCCKVRSTRADLD